jgi:hypothetical protein
VTTTRFGLSGESLVTRASIQYQDTPYQARTLVLSPTLQYECKPPGSRPCRIQRVWTLVYDAEGSCLGQPSEPAMILIRSKMLIPPKSNPGCQKPIPIFARENRKPLVNRRPSPMGNVKGQPAPAPAIPPIIINSRRSPTVTVAEGEFRGWIDLARRCSRNDLSAKNS